MASCGCLFHQKKKTIILSISWITVLFPNFPVLLQIVVYYATYKRQYYLMNTYDFFNEIPLPMLGL